MSILVGDCRTVMATMDADSVDAVVTDPPYGLEFMGKEWDKLLPLNAGNPNTRPSKKHIEDRTDKWQPGASYGAPKKNPRCRICNGLKFNRDERPGKCRCETPQWDTRTAEYGRDMQDWHETWAREAFRVLKPGAFMLAMGGTRTIHRMVSAIEDAGFEIRDQLAWHYAQGFPKGNDFAKDAEASKREGRRVPLAQFVGTPFENGWNVALKPAMELIVVARKPLIGTIAKNVEKYGTGAINIDKCRITSGPSAIISAWEHEQYLCNSCARDAANTPRLEARATKASTATNSVAPTSSEREQTHPDVTDKTDIGCFAGPNRAERDGNQTANGSSSTSRSGKTSTDQSPPATSSITITSMDSTTPPKTCSSCGAAITSDSITNSDHTPSPGRWPSNFILSHSPDCREVGTKRVKVANPSVQPTAGTTGRHGIYGPFTATSLVRAEYADADGMETVTAWECAKDEDGQFICPVAMLDAQSGERKTGTGGTNRQLSSRGYKGGGYGQFVAEDHAYSDRSKTGYDDTTSGASRFFLNVSWQPGELDEAMRFKYCAKSSRRERNSGLDGIRTVKYNVLNEGGPALCEATVTLLQKVTSAIPTVRWLIGESGASIMGQCQQDSLSITLTAIKQTITSPIFSSLTHSLTNESILDANSETVNGGSHAESAESSSPYLLSITDGNQELARGVVSAALTMLSKASDADEWQPLTNIHSTVKPVALMRYLIKLVVPPNGVVMDCFAGSGTTGIAACLEGVDFIGIEQDPEYASIAESRIAHVERHGERWLDAAKKAVFGGPRRYGNGKGMGDTVRRCPEHNGSQPSGSNVYTCGCPLIRCPPIDVAARNEPRHTVQSTDTPTMTDLPLFALVAD